jgi:hypothetical protein
MSDFTSNLVPVSPYSDDLSLPERIAAHYGFQLASKEHIDGKRYYAVQDWIKAVAQPDTDPRIFWNKMKRQLRKAGIDFSTKCQKLDYRASNGKTYKGDYADAEILYQITQRMVANTGLREAVLEFLAKSGVVVGELRVDPEKAIEAAIKAYKRMGKTDRWIETRLRSKVRPTNRTYKIVSDKTVRRRKQEMGLARRHKRALYEMLSAYETSENTPEFERAATIASNLSRLDKVRLVKQVMATLEEDFTSEKKKPKRSLYGLWSDVSVSEEDIDDARREMWGKFPREDI